MLENTSGMAVGGCEMENLVIELLLKEKKEGTNIDHLRELLHQLVNQDNK